MATKLVRARLKAIDQLPPDLLCCPEAIAAMHEAYGRVGEFMLDADSGEPHAGVCRYCGKQDETRMRMHTPGRRGFVYVDEVDCIAMAMSASDAPVTCI